MIATKYVTQEMLDYAYIGGWNIEDVVKSEMKIEAFGCEQPAETEGAPNRQQGNVSKEAESKRIEPPNPKPLPPKKGTA